MAGNRFYIGKREELEEDLWVWISDKIPPAPEGQKCEDDNHVEYAEDMAGDPDDKATTFLYRIEGGHVCYTYVCKECGERGDPEYLADNDYPQTSGGYAVTPTHCT